MNMNAVSWGGFKVADESQQQNFPKVVFASHHVHVDEVD